MKKFPIARFVKYMKRTAETRHKKFRAWFYKFVFFMIEFHGLAVVTISYWLAWNEKTNVLEDLSGTVIREIIAPFIAYTISRTVENIAENNVTAIHVHIGEQTNDLIQNVSESEEEA